MKFYVKFAIYANMPSLVLLTPMAAQNFATGGNLVALMAFYNFVLYIIPVALILAFLIYSLIKGLKPHIAYMTLYFVLSTACMVLLAIAWTTLTPIVIFMSFIVSFIAVMLYKHLLRPLISKIRPVDS